MRLTNEQWFELTGPASNLTIVVDATAVLRELHGVAPDDVALVMELTHHRLSHPYRQAYRMTRETAENLVAVLTAALGFDPADIEPDDDPPLGGI